MPRVCSIRTHLRQECISLNFGVAMSALQLKDFRVLGFASSAEALEAERLIKSSSLNLSARLIPKPACLGNAECGLALRYLPQEEEDVFSLLIDAGWQKDTLCAHCASYQDFSL